ncbi:MAG: hypothetical protein GIW94_12095 [Candidatus Eremiobacteraeota bacterium]|nr:hypothetical protein [Candidatus Eremiobacteraeota bacterium]MBC5820929.1 hypothetical protein [Candidatus Eremiobacteraeota bacterium]
MNALWDAATSGAIGADWLQAELAPAGDFGRRARLKERLLRRGDEARARGDIARVAAVARDVEGGRLRALRAALATAPDPGALIARAASGGVLDDVDFFELSRFLESVGEAVLLTGDGAFADVRPPLADGGLRAHLEQGRTVSRTFYLADAFAPELTIARERSQAAQTAFDLARSHLAERAARYAGVESLRDGEFVLMRDRLTGPVPREIRIVRESPTYLLCELALDEEALQAQAERDAAAACVADAEEAVRARLSARVAAGASALEHACETLGALDLFVARALFAQRHACIVPEIVQRAEIAFEEARYLPLATALAERGRAYLPLTLELNGVGVVTGPNMGGKTAALRTLGFVAACLALGVPVPARAARVPLLDEVAWLGIGAPGASDGLLSTFASEIVDAAAFLQRRPSRALVLADEFARTTSPREGRALLVALLATLRSRGCLALASTHFERVAEAADASHYATGIVAAFADDEATLGLDAALQRIAQAMDYGLRIVTADAPPRADALALAGALGLDGTVLERAREEL